MDGLCCGRAEKNTEYGKIVLEVCNEEALNEFTYTPPRDETTL
jgi:hypothetical protein